MIYDLSNSIGFTIARTQGKLRNVMIRKFREFDLTPNQWAVLNYLSIDYGIPPTEISKITFKDIPNTIRILQKLEKKGLVCHHINPDDKRVSLFYLSDKGYNLRDELFPIGTSVMEQAVKDIDPEKVKELIDLLNKIYDNL
ncbi:MarR family winged helix-turn-helix transcriptional regulator [Bacillus sp. BAU-SS-2023]|nr:MarR family winged helix-turn-helix transcriptional regulator [Bacillus sp. BAU-SS-2023]